MLSVDTCSINSSTLCILKFSRGHSNITWRFRGRGDHANITEGGGGEMSRDTFLCLFKHFICLVCPAIMSHKGGPGGVK